jgi:hypothetical protein
MKPVTVVTFVFLGDVIGCGEGRYYSRPIRSALAVARRCRLGLTGRDSMRVRGLCVAVVSASLLLVPGHAQPGQAASVPAKPRTLTQLWTLDATYRDPLHGVSFRYPSVWKAGTQFGYHPPALTGSGESEPIAGFGYEEGGFPREGSGGPYWQTNLEGFGVVYSAVPGASTAACESKAAALAEVQAHTRTVLGGRSFSVYETGEAGMSQSTSGELYVAYAQGTCTLFETAVSVVSPGVADGIKGLTTAQTRNIEAHLLEIMKSVRIEPKPKSP